MTRALATLALLLAAGCGGSEQASEGHPCPPGGTKLTYQNFGKAFLDNRCQGCHGAPAGGREGAPEAYNFSTLEQVKKHKDRIYARSADDNTSMPPGPNDPPPSDREKLGEWLGCGAP